MDARTLRLLGFDAPSEGATAYSSMGSGLPTIPTGPSRGSSAGLSRTLAQPFNQSAGIVRPTADGGSNPGEMDPLLAAQMAMGDRGGYTRGASAFLGAGYNPFTKEINSQGELVSNPNQNLDTLFDEAQRLGIDTSKYSRDSTVGIRGERSPMDATQLYDDLNNLTKDYVAIDNMSEDGKNSERQLYLDQGGELIPVSDRMSRSGRIDSAFFDDDFKDMLMTIGPAVVGGFMAAPAAGAGQAASTAGSAAGTAGSAGGAAAGTTASGSIPWGQIGTRALRGALTGGLTSGLQGGNILQGALMGGLSGGVSGAGIPSSVLSIGKNVLSGALGMDGGGSGGGGGSVGSGAVASGGGGGGVSPSAPVPGASALGVALGGGSTGGGDSQFFNPDDARQRYLVNALRLNRSGKAGDQSQDRATALQKALAELTG